MKTTIVRSLLGIFLLSTVLLVAAPPAPAKVPKRVAILPFTMHADKDLGFLQEGIMDMLASRLAWKGEVDVLEKGVIKKKIGQMGGSISRDRAIEIGKALQADYVVLGSLTVFGESVSIDAKILDVAKAEDLVTAFNQSKGMDNVIPTVNRFATDINEKIMGRVIGPSIAAAPVQEGPKGPGGLLAAGESFQGKGVGHVQRVRTEIISMDVGDVDGDKKDELVFISTDTVYVYKWKEKGFALIKEVKGSWGAHYVWVSVGDMNRNGVDEIYVTSLGESDVSSLVLEWDGGGLKKIAERQPWFFRVTHIPGKGRNLIGQRRKVGGFYHGDVHILAWQGNQLTEKEPLALPKKGKVFNFAFVDFDRQEQERIVLLDDIDYLRLYDNSGEEIWRSEDYFGGTVTHMTDDSGAEHWVFFPSPIAITDVDEDGKPEVMVCKNLSRTGRLFERLRYFTSGTLYFLTWDQVGLQTKWTSQNQAGPIVGYKVGDVDHDGLKELVIATVIRQDHVMGNPRSQIVVYDLK